MTLQQLEYLVAVDEHRHFGKAAEACYVTQPTLSMMLQKLEEEMGIRFFDRKQQPVVPTPAGIEMIRRARSILHEARMMKAYSRELKGDFSGTLRLGIIPTLAPYLLPLFMGDLLRLHAGLEVQVVERITTQLVSEVLEGKMDLAVLAGPLEEEGLLETPLFQEELLLYTSTEEPAYTKEYVMLQDIHPESLWLLQEGHCFRSQILQLCALNPAGNLKFEAGSLETLVRLVDQEGGMTILPQLAVSQLQEMQKKKIRRFAEPQPTRQICLICHADYPRKALLERVENLIRSCVDILSPENYHMLPLGLKTK